MDPNENLTEQLRLASELIGYEGSDSAHIADCAYRLAGLVEALHAWIIKGGALPVIWEESREREKTSVTP